MKSKIGRILFLFLFFGFINHEALCQRNFFLSLQAGSKLSFSQNYNVLNKLSTSGKWGENFGLRGGYIFQNKVVILETGLSRNRLDISFDLFQGNLPKKSSPSLYTTNYTWQIPVTIKVKVFQPTEKLTLRTITGIAFSFSFSDNALKLAGDAKISTVNGNEVKFQLNNSDNLPTGNYALYRRTNSSEGNWLIEAGIEGTYQVNTQLFFLLSVVNQSGLKMEEASSIYRINENNSLTEIVNTSSKGDGIRFNTGLGFFLGK